MPRVEDPLGVRAASRFVSSRAQHVRLNETNIRRFARNLVNSNIEFPDWRNDHIPGWEPSPGELANYVLVLDSINFCFWKRPRWRVSGPSGPEDGYQALALALNRAVLEGFPLTDARYLASIPAADVAWILRGDNIVPLFAARVACLREVGQGLLRDFEGSFLRGIDAAGGSAINLVRNLLLSFPSFVDVGHYQQRAIPLFKRLQLLVSDLAAAFTFAGPGRFADLDQLTAFADYKVPQVLHHYDLIGYSSELTSLLRKHHVFEPDHPMELEIRAATICAVDAIASELAKIGSPVPEFQLDWNLWNAGQGIEFNVPYHRTTTIAY